MQAERMSDQDTENIHWSIARGLLDEKRLPRFAGARGSGV